MKNLLFAFVTAVIFCFASCSKEDDKPYEIRYVNFDVTLNDGETYNLDLSPYGVQHATVGITKEAANVAGSQLITESTNPFTANYSYTANCPIANDQVIILVQEDDGSKGSGNHSGGNGNKTNHDKTPHPSATDITINFVVACSEN